MEVWGGDGAGGRLESVVCIPTSDELLLFLCGFKGKQIVNDVDNHQGNGQSMMRATMPHSRFEDID